MARFCYKRLNQQLNGWPLSIAEKDILLLVKALKYSATNSLCCGIKHQQKLAD
jgi:hypothetical protein